MANRREFLRAAAEGAGWLAVGCGVAHAQPARKEVRVGGKRVKVVDVHAHCVLPEVNERLPNAGAPRVAPPTLVLGPERIAAMDERGIDVQALSVNGYWWYAADRETAKQIVAIHDEALGVERQRDHEAQRFFAALAKHALGVERHEVNAEPDGVGLAFGETDRGPRRVGRGRQ